MLTLLGQQHVQSCRKVLVAGVLGGSRRVSRQSTYLAAQNFLAVTSYASAIERYAQCLLHRSRAGAIARWLVGGHSARPQAPKPSQIACVNYIIFD